MKFNQHLKSWMTIILLILAAGLLTGCGTNAEKARKPTEDISRGLPLSAEASSNFAAAVHPDGSLVQVVIPVQIDEDLQGLRYQQIDGEGKLIVDRLLDESFQPYLRSPEIIFNQGRTHLIWAARSSTKEGWQLWYAKLDSLGSFQSGPEQITQSQEGISHYEMAADQQGRVLIIWEEKTDNSIRFQAVSKAGALLESPGILVDDGKNPALQAGPEGEFHLIWLQGEDLMYESFQLPVQTALQTEPIAQIRQKIGNQLEGPVLGLEGDYVYIFWSTLRQTGMEAGTAVTEYYVFPIHDPQNISQHRMNIFPKAEDLFQEYEGYHQIRQIIPPPAENYFNTDFVFGPQTSSGNQLAVAVSANLQSRLDGYVQIVIGIFEDGEYQGYIPGTNTTLISKDPNIEVDQRGHLHLLWRDGAFGNQVYYATSSPEAKLHLDKIGAADFRSLILSGGLEALTGILLFPFAFPWMAVSLLILIIWRLARNDEDLSQTPSVILLIVTLIIYQVSKLLFLPDILIYVPFSAWLDIPKGVENLLQILVPVTIFGFGFLVAEIRRRRQQNPPSTLVYFLVVVLIDIVLTLSVYGVVFLGEY